MEGGVYNLSKESKFLLPNWALPFYLNILGSMNYYTTVAFCMIATGLLTLHIATFAKLATRVPKYTIYSNFGACRTRRAQNLRPKTALQLATSWALYVTPPNIATQPAQHHV